MNNLNLPPVNPEQKSETSKNTAWDNLAKLSQTETWEDHVERASRLGKEKSFDSMDKIKKMNIEKLSNEELMMIGSTARDILEDKYKNEFTAERLEKLPEVIHFCRAEQFEDVVNEALRYPSDKITLSDDAAVGGIYLQGYRTKDGEPAIYLSSEACRDAVDLLGNLIHESLHYLNDGKLDTQMIDTQYTQYLRHDIVGEGITEMLAQDALADLDETRATERAKLSYPEYVSFARELSECVGKDAIVDAYLPPDGSGFGVYTIQEKFDSLFTEEENQKCINRSTYWHLYANHEMLTLIDQGYFANNPDMVEQFRQNKEKIISIAKARRGLESKKMPK